MEKVPNILITPLNWGLGHATRCIPIIHALIRLGANIFLASDGRALALLKKEFPDIPAFELPGYKVRYDSASMVRNIALQLPKISSAIYKEKKKVKQIVQTEQIDIIISDNRYGCRNKYCKNIFISHQINIAIPNRRLEIITNKINHHFINFFDECWIPDFAGTSAIAGKLSQTDKAYEYLGPLSRFHYQELPKEYDIIAVLSGPEPQRSFFEKKIIQQLKPLSLKALIVQGKTEKIERVKLSEHLSMVSYLTSDALNLAMLKSSIIIARSGYSTIMDLVVLGKPAILIPTPGQTEQEYLAARLHQKGLFYTHTQKALELKKALKVIKNFNGYSTANTNFSLIDFLEKKLFSPNVI